jgi:cysteine-rich repeat protein
MNNDTGACTTACKNAACGDGFVQAGEQCDVGAMNSNTGACTLACKTASCGDGLVQAGVEQCDLGAMNANTGACTAACKTASCGDGFVQAGVEQCDLGANNSNAGACTLVCKNAVCGDTLVGPGEACDDGNAVNGDGCNTNCVVSGTPLWTQTYNGPASGADFWAAVKADPAGNVYVVGGSPTANQGYNIVVRKYDANGGIVWTDTYNGAANGEDVGEGITVDASGNVLAIGYETVTGQGKNVWLRKYTSAGVLVWTQTYDGALHLDDYGYGVTTNPAGDIFIAGSIRSVAAQGLDMLVAKIAGVNGSIVWFDTITSAGTHDDELIGIALTSSGAVVTTGYTFGATNLDIVTRKYTDNGVSGTLAWNRTYAGLAGGVDVGYSVAGDGSGNVIVSGTETVAGQALNVWVHKYDTNGNDVWQQGFDGAAHLNDQGLGVAVDASNNVVVVGEETLANNSTNVWVRKYTPAGATLWTQTYNGAADGNDGANFVSIDANANVLVCGFETTAGAQGQNAWLRKYAP